MYPIDLTGKTAAVFGVANHRSIAWDIKINAFLIQLNH